VAKRSKPAPPSDQGEGDNPGGAETVASIEHFLKFHPDNLIDTITDIKKEQVIYDELMQQEASYNNRDDGDLAQNNNFIDDIRNHVFVDKNMSAETTGLSDLSDCSKDPLGISDIIDCLEGQKESIIRYRCAACSYVSPDKILVKAHIEEEHYNNGEDCHVACISQEMQVWLKKCFIKVLKSPKGRKRKRDEEENDETETDTNNKKETEPDNKHENEIVTKEITPRQADTFNIEETIINNDSAAETETKETSDKQQDVDETKKEPDQEKVGGCSEPNCDKTNCILNALRFDDEDTTNKYLQMTSTPSASPARACTRSSPRIGTSPRLSPVPGMLPRSSSRSGKSPRTIQACSNSERTFPLAVFPVISSVDTPSDGSIVTSPPDMFQCNICKKYMNVRQSLIIRHLGEIHRLTVSEYTDKYLSDQEAKVWCPVFEQWNRKIIVDDVIKHTYANSKGQCKCIKCDEQFQNKTTLKLHLPKCLDFKNMSAIMKSLESKPFRLLHSTIGNYSDSDMDLDKN